jgi:hypothetical protein
VQLSDEVIFFDDVAGNEQAKVRGWGRWWCSCQANSSELLCAGSIRSGKTNQHLPWATACHTQQTEVQQWLDQFNINTMTDVSLP